MKKKKRKRKEEVVKKKKKGETNKTTTAKRGLSGEGEKNHDKTTRTLLRLRTAPNIRATFFVQTWGVRVSFFALPHFRTVFFVSPNRSPARFKFVNSELRADTSCASVVAMYTAFHAAG